MADRPVRIELSGLAEEREEAERDLQRTLGALEDRLLPQRAARRLVTQHDPALVLAGIAAAGLALGLVRDDRLAVRAAGIVAAVAAGAVLFGITR